LAGCQKLDANHINKLISQIHRLIKQLYIQSLR